MPAIQNQDPGLTHLITIDGEEITEHNRRFSESFVPEVNEVELARGNLKRYIQTTDRTFNLSFSYLPSLVTHTVDGRKGQAYLKEKANKKGELEVGIKLDPSGDFKVYYCYIDSYNETLVRRDIASGCSYYDVTMSLVER
jgi:hypothetical protein